MATSRTNISSKFENGDIPSQEDFGEIFGSFVHKEEDKADLQMVETGTDNEHYVTPELLRIGLQNIGIITGNSYMPKKEYFESSFNGTTLSLEKLPIQYSVKVYKNGQLLQEDQDYTVNYETAVITFSDQVSDRNIEIDYWFKNLSPNPTPGGGGSQPIDLTSFLHTSGNETKNGILTFNNTTIASTSGIALTNSGSGTASASLNVNVSGAGKGISLENSSNGTGVYLNSAAEATGDILQVAKNNVVKVKIEDDGVVTAPKYVTSGGTASQFVKGDGSLDSAVYAKDSEVLHTTGNESKDGALTLTHGSGEDVLTINKDDSANCLKLVQNSNSNATTSTWDTSTTNAGRKAISIQKQEQENAFITHEGDVTANSFTTISSMANLTDGLLTLTNGPSPEASEGKAKLYAKTDGTTDMYVMGSDGIEKKIGEDVNLDNLLHKTGFSTETKTGELVIDSGTANISGLKLNRIITTPSITTTSFASGLNNPWGLCDGGDGNYYVANNGNSTISKINKVTGVLINASFATGIVSPVGICKANDGNLYVTSSTNGTIYKITLAGVVTNFVTGLSNLRYLSQANDGNLYVVSQSGTIHKITLGGTITNLITGLNNPKGIVQATDNNLYVSGGNSIYKVTLLGVSTLFATFSGITEGICQSSTGDFYTISYGGGWIVKVTSSGIASIHKTISSLPRGILFGNDGFLYTTSDSSDIIEKTSTISNDKVLKTDVTGLLVKTTYLEDVPYLKSSDVEISNYAKLDSPNFTGVPTAPTATDGTNTTQIATTAFINNAISTFNNGLVTIAGNQTITGQKTFADHTNFANIGLNNSYILSFGNGLDSISTYGNGAIGFKNGHFSFASVGKPSAIIATDNVLLTTNPILQVQNSSGTIALTNNPTSITATSFVKSGGTSSQYLMADGSTSSSEPSQITITTSVSITTDTLDANSKKQIGKNVVINNGSSVINITVNGGTDFSASYLKIGTGAITFVQGSGRTLVQVDGSALFNGVPGSTATISSVGTVDYLRISNA